MTNPTEQAIEPGEAELALDQIEESLSRQVTVLFDKGLREEGLLVSQASATVGAAIAALRTTTPAPRSVRVADLSDDDLEAIRAAEPSDSQIATDVAVDEDALVERLREIGANNCICERMVKNPTNHHPMCPFIFYSQAADRLQSQQASILAKDAALLPLADEMEGLLPYLAAHHFKIDSLAKVVADARAALADTTKGGE
jgi:hypothetical protein